MPRRPNPAATSPALVKRLRRTIDAFGRARVLVVGDAILDEYVWGDVERISPEAPVPVVCVARRTEMPGGAANVGRNVAALGGRVWLAAPIGRDTAGEALREQLVAHGVSCEALLIEPGRQTSRKTRVIAQGQQVVRMDSEDTSELGSESRKRILRLIGEVLPKVSAVVVADYGKGAVSAPLLKGLLGAARRAGRPVVVDPKTDHFNLYRAVTALTPNQREASEAAGIRCRSAADLLRVGRRLQGMTRAEAVLITRGEQGMSLFERGGKVTHIPTRARRVFDVTGAGDTVIATFTVALLAGAGFRDAARLANIAAGIVVGEVGTAAVAGKDLARRIGSAT